MVSRNAGAKSPLVSGSAAAFALMLFTGQRLDQVLSHASQALPVAGTCLSQITSQTLIIVLFMHVAHPASVQIPTFGEVYSLGNSRELGG